VVSLFFSEKVFFHLYDFTFLIPLVNASTTIANKTTTVGPQMPPFSSPSTLQGHIHLYNLVDISKYGEWIV